MKNYAKERRTRKRLPIYHTIIQRKDKSEKQVPLIDTQIYTKKEYQANYLKQK